MRIEAIHCDRCKNPIKSVDKVYFLYLFTEEDIKSSFGGIVRPNTAGVKEICPECKKMIEDVLSFRCKTLKNYKKEIASGYKLPANKKKGREKNGK